jgi:hypothetical protein
MQGAAAWRRQTLWAIEEMDPAEHLDETDAVERAFLNRKV